MTPDPDDDLADEDAFRWAGDEARGQVAPRLEPVHVTDGESAESAGSADDAIPGSPSPAAALVTGLFAVVYLALTVGWIFAVQWTSSGTAELGTEILWQFGEFLAIASAPLWFATVVALTRDSRVAVRTGWLALGVGVLVPWPLVLGVVAVIAR